jgi:RNA-directed DNA polymerase
LANCRYFGLNYGTCDVKQHFPSIDHAVLTQILGRVIACPDTMNLIGKILTSGEGVLTEEYEMKYFTGDDLWAAARPRGLPIGNLTSQFWSNCYLNPLDHFVKRDLKCPAFIRYVDDFLLFADDKATLHRWRSEIIAFLATLRLTLHPERAQPRPVTEGIPFLGFVIYPDYRRLKGRKAVAARRRLWQTYAAYRRGELEQARVVAAIHGWLGHARHGDTRGLTRHLLTPLVF